MEQVDKSFFEDLHWEGEDPKFYEKYANMWIAVVNKKIIAYGNNLHKVEEEASCKTGKSKKDIAVQFVESPTAIYYG